MLGEETHPKVMWNPKFFTENLTMDMH